MRTNFRARHARPYVIQNTVLGSLFNILIANNLFLSRDYKIKEALFAMFYIGLAN